MGRYQRTVELAQLTAGLEVADLGCGPGRLLDALFASEEPPRLVHALDHTSALDDHLLTDPRVRSVIADLDDALPFTDECLDRVFSVNALEHLVDPIKHLSEVHRVLRPGGLALIVHSDWDTMVFAAGDGGLTRRLVDCFVSAMPTWVSRADGFMGRKLLGLPSLAALSGVNFETVAVDTWADPHRRFDDDSLAHKVAIGIAMAGAADDDLVGTVPGWLEDLEIASLERRFLFCVTDVALVLRKPLS